MRERGGSCSSSKGITSHSGPRALGLDEHFFTDLEMQRTFPIGRSELR
jgi:hypothetical protein